MLADQHAEALGPTSSQKPPALRMRIPRYGQKLALRAVIAGAGALVIANAVGNADLLGQAHADNPQCVATTADPCAPVLGGSVNLLEHPAPQATNPPRTHVVCQPAGKTGAFCYRR